MSNYEQTCAAQEAFISQVRIKNRNSSIVSLAPGSENDDSGLMLLTAPLDFSNKPGLTFARWTDKKYFDVEKVLAAFGNMSGEMIDYGAKALKPVENYVGNFMKRWDNLTIRRLSSPGTR